MKVLHVIASVDPRAGGPIAGVFSSADVWYRHAHERYILSLDSTDAAWVAAAPTPTTAVGPRARWYARARQLVPWLRYGYTPYLVTWLRAHAQEYDAVIINGLWNYASFGTWRALRKSHVPYVVFTHGMLDPWFNEAYPIKTVFKTIFWKLFEHKVLRDAAGVFFTCEEERRLASRSFSPYRCHEFVVGYGAADVFGDSAQQHEAFLAKVPTARDRKYILFLSRIHEKKGIDLLIRAFARHARKFPDLDLVIAGPDHAGLQARLILLAQEQGVAGRIHWPGMLAGDAKWGAFRAAEFFVLPSHQENFGIVVAEAMALGRPVLITNKVNIWREIQADGAGLVVDDTVDAVAAGLLALCALSPAARDAIGHKARACFCQRYDLEQNAMALLALLGDLIATRQKDGPASVARLG